MTTTVQQHILNALKGGTTHEMAQAAQAAKSKVTPAVGFHVSRAMVLAIAHQRIAQRTFKH